uniref:Uncharacterized protein n=1 Tax=Anopheles epiroticus TaxID=199890 RepID=A0A182PCB1_9DIPT
MADGGYDPMGHIQTGRPHAYYLYQAAAAALEQQHQQQQQQQQQHQQQQQQLQEQSTEEQVASRSRPASSDGHENNNNLPAAANNNLFRSEQKKHKRKRLSAVLDKLHNGTGTVVNHNNNNVGETPSFKAKCADSRSSAEDSSAEDVFPYSASPRISISPLRLSEVDENNPLQQSGASHPPHALPHDQQLPSPSQQQQQQSRPIKLESAQQPVVPLQPSQIKQEDQQYLYKQLQYFNPLALFNYLPEPTKLLYQEFARQRSHSDSDLQLQQLQQQQQQQQQPNPPKKKRSNHAGRRPPTSSSRSSNASSSSSGHQDPQEQPLDLSMKSPSLLDSPSLLVSTVIKKEPRLADSPPPSSPVPPVSLGPKLLLKREDMPDIRRSPAFEHLNGHAPPGFNLNVSPVVEEMPPGSDVAYIPSMMDQKPILLPMVGMSTGRAIKKESGFGGVGGAFVLEAKTES